MQLLAVWRLLPWSRMHKKEGEATEPLFGSKKMRSFEQKNSRLVI